jgi:hypothetical protein
MCPTVKDAYLKDPYPRHDVDIAERAPASRVYRPRADAFPRSTGLKNRQVASDRPSIARRRIRTLGRFSFAVLIGVGAATLIGVGATLSWQSYGGEMVRAWAPSLGWLLPTSPSAELTVQPKPVAVDLSVTERSVEQLASNQDQLARKQDQMTQGFATLPAAVQDINQYALASAPLAPNAALVPPPTKAVLATPTTKAALVPLPKPKPALILPPKPKAAFVPPPELQQSRDITSNSSANAAGDFGRSGQFGRASPDSDTRTIVGAAVR